MSEIVVNEKEGRNVKTSFFVVFLLSICFPLSPVSFFFNLRIIPFAPIFFFYELGGSFILILFPLFLSRSLLSFLYYYSILIHPRVCRERPGNVGD